MTNLPIQKVLQKPDVARRMVRWAVELSEFDIQYEPRGSIKGQVYADFVAELSPGGDPQELELGAQWVLSVDESSNQQGSGAGIILEGPNGVLIEQALRYAFKASNNQAEYEVLIAGMLLAKEMGAQSLLAKSDSQLVTGQVTGGYQAKDPQMAAYLRYVEVLKRAFAAFELVHVPREQNARADLLAKLASSGKGGRQRTVIQETLKTPRKFVADNRVDVLHFGVPRRLISDNGTQFASQQLGKLCTEVGIKQVFASVEHPQTNRQVESANRVLLRGLKRRLEKAKGAWAEEVPRIVWAYHTTPQSSTMETPFSLVYGSDAMIPVEIHESSPRFLGFVAEESNEERRVNLDLIDEAREEAKIKAEVVKRRVERQYSSKVKLRQFQIGDLVMRKAHPYELENKLSPKWTGPFRVTKAKGNGLYMLETLEGAPIPRSWNAANLKFYFS
ncbi:uncharacterized protein [Phaseolus vulgaris]|uniref:uncharacterized protein n=1 Tax=Phaseolus vulgaris TaxID=3885 RepID=UPI0035CC4FF8